MDDNEKLIYGGLGIVALGAITLTYIQQRKETRKKRKKLEAETAAELRAIHIATGVMMEKIESRNIHGSIQDLMDEFEFQIIINRDRH